MKKIIFVIISIIVYTQANCCTACETHKICCKNYQTPVCSCYHGTPIAMCENNTMTTLISSPNPSNVGQMVTLTVNVIVIPPGSGNLCGSVIFYSGLVGGTVICNIALTNDLALCDTNFNTSGSYMLQAGYSGCNRGFYTSDSNILMQSVD